MRIKKYEIGFTDGVFDLFHIGHLNLLRSAKFYCNKLIVGVHSDDIVFKYKKHFPTINENDRKSIVESIKYVDKCVINNTRDKETLWKLHRFNVLFIGDDWKGTDRWNEIEKTMKKNNVDVIYLPYTKGVSSTIIKKDIKK